MTELIHADVRDATDTLTLDRPKALNALTLDMIEALTSHLETWSADPDVQRVHMESSSSRAFCAGGDVRALAAFMAEGGDWLSVLRAEYALQQLVGEYPKPVSVRMTGVTMGGGLGLGAAASRRTVDETTVMAMPETTIGWVPDAGMMFYLARAGAVGVHCALSSASFGAGDALRMNLADALLQPSEDTLDTPLHDATWIEDCYQGDDVLKIVRRLESYDQGTSEDRRAAREASESIRSRSPLAVHVALRALRRAAEMTAAEVFAQDLAIAGRLLPIDFPEGVRAQLVDKDQNPSWRHASLEDVTAEEIDAILPA